MPAYYSRNLTYTLLDCEPPDSCQVTRNEVISRPPASHVAAIHRALNLERERLDKRAKMFPTESMKNIGAVDVKSTSFASSSTIEPMHFCHIPNDKGRMAYLKKYHCGFNKINICHYNGKEYTTMCGRAWSALFQNLDPVDYCGVCRGDEAVEPKADPGKNEAPFLSTGTGSY